MLNRFLDLERLICCHDWEAQSSRGHYLCCLGQRRTNLRKKLLIVHPEAPDIQPLADEVALWQMDRQASQPRIADKMSARRERACDRRRRWTAHGIKTERYWHSTRSEERRVGKECS